MSLTFRTALSAAAVPVSSGLKKMTASTSTSSSTSSPRPRPLPRVESSNFPPRWGRRRRDDDDDASNVRTDERGKKTEEEEEENADARFLSPPEEERKNVHAVYDAIASQWHHTRGRRGTLWPRATRFVKDLEEGSVVADVGCGDGKYFPAVHDAGCYVVGTDMSVPLLRTALIGDGLGERRDEDDDDDDRDGDGRGKAGSARAVAVVADSRRVRPSKRVLDSRPGVAAADCMSLPHRPGSFDAALCVAVMHHLSTEARRVRCLAELVRVVRAGGLINVQAWAMDQEGDVDKGDTSVKGGRRRRFDAPDVFVPFMAQPKYLGRVGGRGRGRGERK